MQDGLALPNVAMIMCVGSLLAAIVLSQLRMSSQPIARVEKEAPAFPPSGARARA